MFVAEFRWRGDYLQSAAELETYGRASNLFVRQVIELVAFVQQDHDQLKTN